VTLLLICFYGTAPGLLHRSNMARNTRRVHSKRHTHFNSTLACHDGNCITAGLCTVNQALRMTCTCCLNSTCCR